MTFDLSNDLMKALQIGLFFFSFIYFFFLQEPSVDSSLALSSTFNAIFY